MIKENYYATYVNIIQKLRHNSYCRVFRGIIVPVVYQICKIKFVNKNKTISSEIFLN